MPSGRLSNRRLGAALGREASRRSPEQRLTPPPDETHPVPFTKLVSRLWAPQLGERHDAVYTHLMNPPDRQPLITGKPLDDPRHFAEVSHLQNSNALALFVHVLLLWGEGLSPETHKNNNTLCISRGPEQSRREAPALNLNP